MELLAISLVWCPPLAIASRFKTPVHELMAFDGLTKGDLIRVGEHLRVPVAVHMVKPGDSLVKIAAAYGTTDDRLWR